ncbi:MAG: hypothetical protein Q4E24_02125 [bacterium]|nr:hypothetical protein [bacterium]
MKNKELELVTRYAPYLMFDEKEPFLVNAIGYTIFTETRKSDSFRRSVRIEKEKVDFAIEYAVCWDYDIQHLYELEHVWVYVDYEGKVCGCEASYHGKYINQMLPGADIVRDETHVCLYSQPGKHALLPERRLIYLYPDWKRACGELAGADGFAYPEYLFDVPIPVTDEQQEMVRSYIREHYRFVPTMEFVQRQYPDCFFRPWSVLREEIPLRMKAELEKIKIWAEKAKV